MPRVRLEWPLGTMRSGWWKGGLERAGRWQRGHPAGEAGRRVGTWYRVGRVSTWYRVGRIGTWYRVGRERRRGVEVVG